MNNQQMPGDEAQNNQGHNKPFYKKVGFVVVVVLFLLITIIVLLGGKEDNYEPTNPEEFKKTEINKDSDKKAPSNSSQEKIKENDDIIIDINEIIGKSSSEIENLLGEAEKIEQVSPSNTPCEKTPCKKSYFQSDKYEIVFIGNKASWITISPEKQYRLNEKAIELIGLPKKKPDFKNEGIVLRWEEIENIIEISFFDDGSGNIDYIYIKANYI